MLNHLFLFNTTPPMRPPCRIQSTRIGMNEIFVDGGMRSKMLRFQIEMLAKS